MVEPGAEVDEKDAADTAVGLAGAKAAGLGIMGESAADKSRGGGVSALPRTQQAVWFGSLDKEDGSNAKTRPASPAREAEESGG